MKPEDVQAIKARWIDARWQVVPIEDRWWADANDENRIAYMRALDDIAAFLMDAGVLPEQ